MSVGRCKKSVRLSDALLTCRSFTSSLSSPVTHCWKITLEICLFGVCTRDHGHTVFGRLHVSLLLLLLFKLIWKAHVEEIPYSSHKTAGAQVIERRRFTIPHGWFA